MRGGARTCRRRSSRKSPTVADVARHRRGPGGEETPPAADPFDEIDFGSFFDDYLDPGLQQPRRRNRSKSLPSRPSFPRRVTLGDHLRSQLSVSVLSDEVRDAAESIIGNLDEDGYLTASLEEIAEMGEHTAGAGRSGAQGGAVARSGGRGRARSARVPAAAAREPRTARAAWPGRSCPTTCGCSKRGSSANWRKVLGRPLEHIDIAVQSDPAPESAAGPALFRAGRAAWWSPTSTSSRTATITSSR